MDARHYRFSVGGFECLAVSDGALVSEPPEAPGPILFANAPPADLDAAVRESGGSTPWTRWTEEITCLLVDTGTQKILVDAGAGGLDPATGRLVENLADAGVAPSDIDMVILSHGHPDHVGGLVDRGRFARLPDGPRPPVEEGVEVLDGGRGGSGVARRDAGRFSSSSRDRRFP